MHHSLKLLNAISPKGVFVIRFCSLYSLRIKGTKRDTDRITRPDKEYSIIESLNLHHLKTWIFSNLLYIFFSLLKIAWAKYVIESEIYPIRIRQKQFFCIFLRHFKKTKNAEKKKKEEVNKFLPLVTQNNVNTFFYIPWTVMTYHKKRKG